MDTITLSLAKKYAKKLMQENNITDEQVLNAITLYLNEHPEATTTIADGSITYKKMNDDLKTEIDEIEILANELGITYKSDTDNSNEDNNEQEVLDYADDIMVGYYNVTQSQGKPFFSFSSADYGLKTVNFDVQEGEKYILTGTIYGAVALYVLKDSCGNIVSGFPTSEQSSTKVQYVETVEIPSGVTTLGFSFLESREHSVVKISGGNSGDSEKPTTENKTLKERVEIVEEKVESHENSTKEVLKYFLNNVLCIGDSLTAGYYHNGTKYVVAKENYPFYLKRMLNAESVDNVAESGYTTTQWYTQFADTVDYSKYDTSIVWLGTNEGLTDTLASDTSSGTYSTYAETHTGYYCRIIEKMIEQNPNIRIFLGTVYVVSGPADPVKLANTNKVINQIAEKYSSNIIGVVNNNDGVLYNGENQELWHPFHGINGDKLHFGKVGNLHLAKHWIDGICDIISNNEKMYEILFED